MSLRLRLTLAYALLQVIVVGVLGLVLHAAMLQQLETEVQNRLELRAQQVELAVRPGTTSLTREELVSAELNLALLPGRIGPAPYVQVLGKDKRVVATSDNLRGRPLPIDDASVASALAGRRSFSTTIEDGEDPPLRILSVPITSDRMVIGVLQVGRSLRTLEETMAQLRALLGLLGAGALAAAGLIGWLVAHQGLRPLFSIARQASAISNQGDFGRRIRYAGPSDEVGVLAETVNQLLARVTETLQSHRDFIADTSHELRNPLLAIQTNLELIDRVPDREARLECVREARQQVERMSRLVADLLMLARIETGQVVERRPLALDRVVERVAHAVRPRAEGRDVRLERVEPIQVLGDEGRLAQILTNLLDNALRHTPMNGTISVRLERQDGWAHLSVTDTGEGIRPADLPHIFERFYRGDRSAADRDDGTGLGLAIVKYLTEAHDGRVTAESELGRGSSFTVWLPVRR